MDCDRMDCGMDGHGAPINIPVLRFTTVRQRLLWVTASKLISNIIRPG